MCHRKCNLIIIIIIIIIIMTIIWNSALYISYRFDTIFFKNCLSAQACTCNYEKYFI
uniref:Uncharacterized protein n=1 Tax=Stegastes partitus TaxID=144197 RepID=A0A3B5ARD4_9TELE